MAIIGSTGAVGQELKRLVQENYTDPSALICFDSKSSISFDGIENGKLEEKNMLIRARIEMWDMEIGTPDC